jgi:pSer/pThr/pTyr-binding forkhead associated (FHA) protein
LQPRFDQRYCIETVARYFLQFGAHAVTLTQGTLRIGRSPRCDIRVENPGVSRHHATLFFDALGLRIRDEQSSNGLYVNGRRVHGTAVLSSGDRLSIGSEECEVRMANEPSEIPTQQHARIEMSDTSGKGLESLSHRERQVFEMIVHGHGNREIGEKLSLSPKTIETYRARLGEKLGVKTRANMIDLALRLGVLNPSIR